MWRTTGIALLFAFGLGASSLFASDKPSEGQPTDPSCAGAMAETPALPWSMIVWDDIAPPIRPTVEAAARTDFATLQAFAPSGDHLFHWTGAREQTAQKQEVVFVFTNHATVASQPVGQDLSPDGDAGTIMTGSRDNLRIYVFLFVDRIFYDFGGLIERPDAFTRLLVALAHETFGNVQHFLELDLATVGERPTDELRFKMEVRAFKAGLRFIQRFRRQFAGETAAGSLMQHMQWAELREQQHLDVWRARLEALTHPPKSN